MASGMVMFAWFAVLIRIVSTIDVYPDFTSTNCDPQSVTNTSQNLINALQRGERTITLKEHGCYLLDKFVPIENVSEFYIGGYERNSGNYIVQCSRSIGLAFVHVKGLKIENIVLKECGLSSEHVVDLSNKINQTVQMFYKVPAEIGYGWILADCSNVEVNNVVVRETIGIGILAINVIGTSSFNHLSLINNRAPTCFFTHLKEIGSVKAIGGGMFILYQDFQEEYFQNISPVQLFINNTIAVNNSYCAAFTTISTLYGSSLTANQIGYSVGTAGGLGLSLAQLKYNVFVYVSSSIFQNNTAWSAAGAHVDIFSGVRGSNVMFDNCSFLSNGFKDYSYHPFGIVTSTAGLLIIHNAAHPDETVSELCALKNLNASTYVLIRNSIFNGNSAEVCGNVEILSYHSLLLLEDPEIIVRIENSTMRENQGSIGPAFCSVTVDSAAKFSKVYIELNSVTISSNIIHLANGNVAYNLADSSGQMVLISSNIRFSGSTTFSNNSGVAIIGISSNLYFTGSVVFHKNVGNFGGALQLIQSHIVIQNYTHLNITENHAMFEGGGIYYGSYSSYQTAGKSDCFLYFQYIDELCNYSSCPDISNLNFTVQFRSNTAAASGGTVFGSTLNGCPWYYEMKNGTNTSITGIQMLSEFPEKFYFDPPLNNSSVISTDTATLEIKSLKQKQLNSAVNVSPGERLEVILYAYDSFGYRTNTPLLSSSDNSSLLNSTLGDSVYWFIKSSDKNGTVTPIDIAGLHENSFTTIDIFSSSSSAVISLNVHLVLCGFGFQYDNTSRKCVCGELTKPYVTCNPLDQTLTVEENHWFGPLNLSQNSNIPVYKTCFYDFCRQGVKTFKSDDVDYQCNPGYNRTGLICSKCKNGTSTVFGSNRCLKCSNKYLFWIPILAVAGIGITMSIAFLDITIAGGYINGFIFYCNCVDYFLPYLSSKGKLNYIFTLISWVNLAVGIESCFYDGMDELARVTLRLLVPLYLYIIMGIIVVIARKFKWFSKIPISASRTFATLFVLSYFNIFGSCVFLLGFMKFEGEHFSYYGWMGDVSVEYGHNFHALLVVIATMLMVMYVLPIPILLLFPSLLYRFRYTRKLKPILDAFWNPFKPNFRFWLALRSLFRFIPFILALYVKYPANVFGLAIAISVGWFIQERCLPFQGFWRNAFDSFFLLNLLVLLFSNIYFEHYKEENSDISDQYTGVVFVTVSLAYVAFALIICIHLYQRFPFVRHCIEYLKGNVKKKESPIAVTRSIGDEHLVMKGEYPDPVSFTEFREPLLDDDPGNYGSVNNDKISS